MDETTSIDTASSFATSDGFIIVVVSIVLAVFGIIVGFQIGSEIAKKVTTRKEYIQKSVIAYGITIVFSAFVWATGYIVLSFLTIGALGGLIAGLTMGFGENLGPFKVAQNFAGRKTRKIKNEGNAQQKKENETNLKQQKENEANLKQQNKNEANTKQKKE